MLGYLLPPAAITDFGEFPVTSPLTTAASILLAFQAWLATVQDFYHSDCLLYREALGAFYSFLQTFVSAGSDLRAAQDCSVASGLAFRLIRSNTDPISAKQGHCCSSAV